MAKARTSTELSQSWSARIQVPAVSGFSPPALASVMVSPGIGPAATLTWAGVAYQYFGAAKTAAPPLPWPPGAFGWVGYYQRYTAQLGGPPFPATVACYLWCQDGFQTGGAPPIPAGGRVYIDPFDEACSWSVSGIYVKGERVVHTPADREAMDFSDMTGEYTWYADEATTFTGDFCGLTVNQSVAVWPGHTQPCEFEIGTNWASTVAFNVTNDDAAITGDLARAVDWEFNGIPVDASLCELFSPGTDVPDANNPTWGRTAPSSGAYWHIVPAANGMGIRHSDPNGARGAKQWAGAAWGPYDQTFNVPGDLFDAGSQVVYFYGPIRDRVRDASPAGYHEVVRRFNTPQHIVSQHLSWRFPYEETPALSGNTALYVHHERRPDLEGQDYDGVIEREEDVA